MSGLGAVAGFCDASDSLLRGMVMFVYLAVVSYQHLALRAAVNWTPTNSDIYPPVRQQPFLLLRDLAVRVY